MVLISSGDTQTSKNILTKDYISKAIQKLKDFAYDELYVLVDFVYESEECSFGADINDPVSPELIGDIEIGNDLALEEQYYALIHELGHAFLYANKVEPKDVVLLETLAWCEGLKITTNLGLQVNERKFREQMMHALLLYDAEAKKKVYGFFVDDRQN
tara:strand:- start:3443 stop:3916 length:474 start_codon:yes stop_codon:yes gene_type:complete